MRDMKKKDSSQQLNAAAAASRRVQCMKNMRSIIWNKNQLQQQEQQ